MKKFFTILGGISILALSTVSFTSAYTQEQIEAYQWAYKYNLTTQPTIEGARMNSPLTRQAFAKMVVNYLENVVGVNQSTSNSCYFLDEGKITNDLIPYTKKTCAYQIMGFDGKNFNPTQIVDRAQLGTVFSRILWGNSHNVDGKGYYIYHVNALQDVGIMNNISNVLGTPAKRGDVLIMFKRMYEKFGSDVYLNNGGQSSNYSKTNNRRNNSKLDVIDYNDLLVEIYTECDEAMEDFNVVFDDEEPSVDVISKSLKNAINSCKNAKDNAVKAGDFEGDSTLKDALIMTLDANINFLELYETGKPYWNKDNVSEDDKTYQKLISDLEKKYNIMDKSFEYLGEIQEAFAKKHGFELDDLDYDDNKDYDYNKDSDKSGYLIFEDDGEISINGYVIYTGKDGKVFYYDREFLEALKNTAEKKGESDLIKYIEVEMRYNDNGDQIGEFDSDEFYKEIGIDFDNLDKDNLTKAQKDEIAEKFTTWANSIVEKAKEINEEYTDDFYNLVKNTKDDKFGLNERYNKTKDYIEAGNTFLEDYSEIMSNFIKTIATAEEDEDNAEESIRTAISMLTLTLDFKSKTDAYNEYNEGWVKDTIDLLGGELIY